MEGTSVGSFLLPESFNASMSVLGIKEDYQGDLSKIAISKFLKGDIEETERIMSKNIVIINSIHKNGFESLPPVSIRNRCPECSGNGFNLTFFKTIEVKCPSCNGTRWKISQCTRCSGTGKIGETTCFICHGRGTYIYKKTDKYAGKKCITCDGTGKVKKLNPSSTKIQDISFCKKCNSTGMLVEVTTPVISAEIAEQLHNLKLDTSNNKEPEPDQNSITIEAQVEKKKKSKKVKPSITQPES